jgi:molybdate transport system regulatory protein
MKTIPFKLNGRIWLEIDDEKILGKGRVELLERIQNSGSIRQAALQMKMSYKQAWDIINQINSKLPLPAVTSQRGGKGGGSAVVTETGLRLIVEFHKLQQKFYDFLNQQDLLEDFANSHLIKLLD